MACEDPLVVFVLSSDRQSLHQLFISVVVFFLFNWYHAEPSQILYGMLLDEHYYGYQQNL